MSTIKTRRRKSSAVSDTKITIRVPTDIINHIDALLDAMPLPISRTYWIVQALNKEVERQEEEQRQESEEKRKGKM
jgi:predicted transcriptional regulator